MNKIKGKFDTNSFLLLVTVILFVCLYVIGLIVFKDKNFGKPQVFLNLFIDNAGLIVAAVGMTFVLITGGIDISVGSVIALVCMMLAYFMEKMHMSVTVSIVLCLGMGLIFGLVQGFLISYLKLQPFIVTLAGLFFARGMTAVISSNMISVTNETVLKIANYKIYLPILGQVNKKGIIVYPYVYPSVVIALVILFLAFVFLRYTRFGRSIYAVGGNEQSALLMGLNVKLIKLKVYILNGFLAAAAGIVFFLNSCGGFVEQARGFEMEAIASAVIGGTLLTGGVGSVIGSLFGVLIKATIETIINFQGSLSSWWTKIAIAALLCFFIILQSILSSKNTKNRILVNK
jgi:simple sugar transport system permease protein